MKYYGVRNGKEGPQVYTDWKSCENAVKGFSGAKFKAFPTQEEAETFINSVEDILREWPTEHHICCDGASSLKNDTWEFKLVWTDTRELIYQSPVYKGGTNNTAEFCGLCTAFKYIIENNLSLDTIIYTDSMTAIAWYNKCLCSAKSLNISDETRKMLSDWEDYIGDRVNYEIKVVHWNNHIVGENPADFGRK